MLKMLMDPMGGIVMTNDGNAILREVSCCVSLLAGYVTVVPGTTAVDKLPPVDILSYVAGHSVCFLGLL